MYHISNDKRAIRSAQKIGDGILKCLQNKNFAEITVTEVQKAASVGRATFYRLFDNTSDVLTYLCDNVFETTAKQYKKLSVWNAEQTTLTFIRTWMENKVLLKAIVECNRIDFIFRSHIKYLSPVKDVFFSGIDMDETQTSYLMTTLTACTAATLISWLSNGGQETAEQIQIRIKDCFRIIGKIFD